MAPCCIVTRALDVPTDRCAGSMSVLGGVEERAPRTLCHLDATWRGWCGHTNVLSNTEPGSLG